MQAGVEPPSHWQTSQMPHDRRVYQLLARKTLNVMPYPQMEQVLVGQLRELKVCALLWGVGQSVGQVPGDGLPYPVP